MVAVVCSPFLAGIFFGYPVKKFPSPDGSRRCFKVGEAGQFVSCLRTGLRLNGADLVHRVTGDISSFSPFFPAALCITLASSAGAVILLTFQGETVEKKKFQHAVDKKKRKE